MFTVSCGLSVLVVQLLFLIEIVIKLNTAVLMPSGQGGREAVGLTRTCALVFAALTSIGEALHVVVVTGLVHTHLLLEPQHLCPVFA